MIVLLVLLPLLIPASVLAARLVVRSVHRRRIAAELRGDWWERFEKQFRAYASGSSRTATDL